MKSAINYIPMIVLFGLPLLVGCPAEQTGTTLGATLTGTVTLDGSPVEGAIVTLKPKSKGSSGAFGKTDAEGNFAVNSSPTVGGVNPGDYMVTVKKIEFPQSAAVSEDDPNYTGAAGPEPKPIYIVPEKYSDTKTSDLSTTVTSGENTLTLDLKSN